MYLRRSANGLPARVARFFQQLNSVEFEITSPGAGQGKFPIATDPDGLIDPSFLPAGVMDHVLDQYEEDTVLHYAPPGTSMVSAPTDGTHQRRTDHDVTYCYDGGRSRWYGVSRWEHFAFVGSIAGGTYGRKEGLVTSATRGMRIPHDLVLLGIAWQMDGAVVGDWEVHRGGSSIYSVSHNAASATVSSLNTTVSSTDVLAIYNASGTVANAIVSLNLARTTT